MKKSFIEWGGPKGEQECCCSSSATMSSYFSMNWILLLLCTGPTVLGSHVKGEVGQNITVPCSYSVKVKQDITSMCWGRGSCPVSKCYQTIIWTDGWKVTEQHNSRYMLKGDLLRGDVSLTIVNAQEADSGIYCCRVEIWGWFNDQTSNHEVVIEKAPGNTSKSTFTITRTWPLISASEAPHTNMSVSLSSQQYSENWLYIGSGLCGGLLAILILALFLTRRSLHNKKKMGNPAKGHGLPERILQAGETDQCPEATTMNTQSRHCCHGEGLLQIFCHRVPYP
ncbi:hepatitis A virus cellular receptor 2 isoform X6 [Heliangelus exortis]|uniref:hepatitis A virus cellular receptor 2 isoform X6 n=1 Tax=Heliangelus exortis TaxID=472823 RepID=UPI003A8DDBE9